MDKAERFPVEGYPAEQPRWETVQKMQKKCADPVTAGLREDGLARAFRQLKLIS